MREIRPSRLLRTSTNLQALIRPGSGLLILGSTLLTSLPAASQEETPADVDPEVLLWHEASALFPVRVHLPPDFDATRTYPAVVALHGFGSSSEGMERVGRTISEAGFIAVLPDAPYPVPYGFSDSTRHAAWELSTWTEEIDLGPPLSTDPAVESRSRDLTIFEFLPSVIERTRTRYRVGPLFAFGFSLGGVYALGGAFYHRDLIDGVVAFGVAGIAREWFEIDGGTMEAGRDLPVRLVVGHSDRYVPVAEAERGRDLFLDAGYDVVLDTFDGGHTDQDEALRRAVEWLKGLAEQEPEGG